MSECTGELIEETDQPLIVRQPIFDRDKSVWGYEFVAKGDMALKGEGLSGNALHDLIVHYKDAMSGMYAGLGSDKKIFFNIDQAAYLECSCSDDELKDCVLGVCDEAACSSQCATFANAARSHGGMVVMDCSAGADVLNNMLESCDIIKVSMQDKTPAEIVKIRKQFKEFGGVLLATDVVTWEDYEGTRALGFKYFQGPFFTIPEMSKDEELSASSVAKLQLLRELNNPGCEMAELSSIIASDVSLSYRILRYINSASFGLKTEIKSIQQAVSMIGLKELKHWATLVVMTDLDSTPKGEELAFMALQRGRFLSSLAGAIKDFKHSANTMFMLGLFSKLDALLSYPMEKALVDIPISQEMKDGLCGKLNEFRDWVLMLDAVEVGNWQIANRVLERYGACFTSAATEYMKAASWAAQQLPNMKH